MTDKFFDVVIEKALAKAGEAAELAYAIYGLIGGDGPEEAAQLLEKYGYTDENGEWIHTDDA
jgi:hypothetical protein